MMELSMREDQAGLVAVYHQGAQFVTVLTAPAVILLSVFAGGVVFMWSGDAGLAENTAPILSALVLGNFLHGLMHMPFGGIDRRVEQEGPNRGELAIEMRREALHVGDRAGPAEPLPRRVIR